MAHPSRAERRSTDRSRATSGGNPWRQGASRFLDAISRSSCCDNPSASAAVPSSARTSTCPLACPAGRRRCSSGDSPRSCHFYCRYPCRRMRSFRWHRTRRCGPGSVPLRCPHGMGSRPAKQCRTTSAAALRLPAGLSRECERSDDRSHPGPRTPDHRPGRAGSWAGFSSPLQRPSLPSQRRAAAQCASSTSQAGGDAAIDRLAR